MLTQVIYFVILNVLKKVEIVQIEINIKQICNIFHPKSN